MFPPATGGKFLDKTSQKLHHEHLWDNQVAAGESW